MERFEVQEALKEILEGAIQRGNEQKGVTVQEFVNELKEQLENLLGKVKV
ncbi:hypothetical protein [Ureibacillus aquaedulcis]|uniref:Uncharacterized protein n=1 Tax=Ureibacillus aquaedulcis TaxID=3058421 RepID=A0ABT8GUP3_9BACL|nr:hypothetical protein [Ureibacillus sp. BA0131]MDN4495129.1 hypothetical protein [Ureibacillus sp. BA0131]